MNSINFCVVYIFAVVMVLISNADSEVFREVKATHVGPFNFGYKLKDFLVMQVTLKNIPPSVTAVYVVYSTKTVFYQKDPDSTPKKEIVQAKMNNTDVTFIILRTLEEPNILLDVELQTRDGLCQTSRVAEGRSAGTYFYYRSGNEYVYWFTGWKHDDIRSCLSPNLCAILMDFNYQCQDESNRNVAVVSSLSFMAVILVLIIIGFWKPSWIECKQSDTSRRINEPSEPFYLNMLFRQECDWEIVEIEQHKYEEIGEPLYDEIQNQNGNLHPEENMTDRVASTSSSGTFPIFGWRASTLKYSRPWRAGTAQQHS